VRLLPHSLSRNLGRVLARAYARFCPTRRNIVVDNVLPALEGDPAMADEAARRLYDNFGMKLVDLLRYESGVSIDHLLTSAYGYEHLARVRAQGRGALLINFHLGNWELGARRLLLEGVRFKVITQAEPGNGFTELRQACRKRWKIDTIVVGNDSFAFLEVIRLLEQGAANALLIDRPPAPARIEVNLFGRPFGVSIAAAELARATGCALLPGYIVWKRDHYEANLLPEVPYDRASLRQRENRVKLSQEIVARMEPVIREYLEQWYHFVPIWDPADLRDESANRKQGSVC
jgi:lauroyl/myristoyl acyltransferase